MHIHVHMCMYTYTCTHTYIDTYIHMHILTRYWNGSRSVSSLQQDSDQKSFEGLANLADTTFDIMESCVRTEQQC